MSEKHRPYRDALGQFATGVTVVTCQPPNGAALGITVNSFASVSLEPPLVSWCLARASRVFHQFADSGNYGVSILAADQIALSRRFATPGSHSLDGLETFPLSTGAPLLSGALANFDCAVVNRVEAGDHLVLFGEVKAFRAADPAPDHPLLYYRSSYFLDLRKEKD